MRRLLLTTILAAMSLPAHAENRWLSFEAGATNLYQSTSAYTISPQVGYAPRLGLLNFADWVSAVPRALFQLNKSATTNVYPIFEFEAAGRFRVIDKVYAGPGIGLGAALGESGSSGAFLTLSAEAGYQLHFASKDALVSSIRSVFVNYRRLFSTVGTNQFSAGLDFCF